jgi:prepilin-type N-terminal cleavage/methylation domain-containing protein
VNRIFRHSKGFTLTELTIVLVIVALLMGGMLVPISAQRDLQNYRETQKQLADISEALLGYAATHTATSDGKPYFPCPDIDNDGFEDRTGNTCTNQEGRLPWGELGVGREDAWGNRFRYRVVKDYSNRAAGFALTLVSTETLKICEDSTCAPANTVLAKDLPVVIISHGKNGAGAFNVSGGTNPAPAGADENSNRNADSDFVSHIPSTLAGNEFDDLVAWISPYVLFNRMIVARRLP